MGQKVFYFNVLLQKVFEIVQNSSCKIQSGTTWNSLRPGRSLSCRLISLQLKILEIQEIKKFHAPPLWSLFDDILSLFQKSSVEK